MRVFIVFFLFVITLVSFASAAYFYRQYRFVIQGQNRVEEIQKQAILAIIGKVIDLPQETPTIVTVTDAEKLPDQVFFENAINGDKIIIYEGAKRVFLYRPTSQKVIDVATLTPKVPWQPSP